MSNIVLSVIIGQGGPPHQTEISLFRTTVDTVLTGLYSWQSPCESQCTNQVTLFLIGPNGMAHSFVLWLLSWEWGPPVGSFGQPHPWPLVVGRLTRTQSCRPCSPICNGSIHARSPLSWQSTCHSPQKWFHPTLHFGVFLLNFHTGLR